jgi:Xaa-Pro aminopeptidase
LTFSAAPFPWHHQVREVETQHRFAGVPYLGFRRLTLVPIQTKMIDASQLKPEDVAWLDQYHADVWAEVSPRLQGKPEVLEWLKKNTRPLAEQQS